MEREARRVLAVVGGTLLLLLILDRSFPPPVPPGYSVQVFDRDGELLSAFLTTDDKWRLRTRLDHVTPELVQAIVAKEDRYFLLHPGINVFAVARALYANIAAGDRVSGASTITMQLARILEPDERSYLVKFREMLRALQLELRYSKRDILEHYVSLLPMGGNIEGAASASWIYFNRPPDKLSLAQAVALAVLPNDPNALRLDRRSTPLQRVTRRWLRRFQRMELFPPQAMDEALAEDLTVARNAPPQHAQQFARVLRQRSRSDLLASTIDAKVQDAAQRLLFNHVQRVMADGVGNGAVLVLRNDSMDVAAWVGSADFSDVAHEGQVDGVTAVRSPGSTLKSFLYARAFDEGILTPQMRLLDIPSDFGGYTPENYDAIFHGDVTVEDALLQSLNIPAVRELARQGTGDFVNWLRQMGFDEIARQKEQLGLSMILGGCGATLEQLTHAYTMFARGGELAPMRFFRTDRNIRGKPVLSEASAFIVSDILAGHKRPDIPAELLAASQLPRIAWKTGTSYGKRDAWAIGWNGRYTIGVWMGNFNGKGAPSLSGAVMAVPLLVDLFNAIDRDHGDLGIRKPEEVQRREVCARTGLLFSPHCEESVRDWAIAERSTQERCALMQPFLVNAQRTEHYCMDCLPSQGSEEVWYPVYDAGLSVWFAESHIGIERPPPHFAGCTARRAGEGPELLSPTADYTYYLERGAEQEILLQAASPPGVKMQYWYVDGDLYCETEAGGRSFYKPNGRKHRISCMDDAGRESSVTIDIVYY